MKKHETISSFERVTLHVSGMRFAVDYELVMRGGDAEVSQYAIRYVASQTERLLEKRATVSEEAALQLLNDCQTLSWDGFRGAHPCGVRDGTMFSFEAIVNGGRRLRAAGSENFPKHYREFLNGISAILNRM